MNHANTKGSLRTLKVSWPIGTSREDLVWELGFGTALGNPTWEPHLRTLLGKVGNQSPRFPETASTFPGKMAIRRYYQKQSAAGNLQTWLANLAQKTSLGNRGWELRLGPGTSLIWWTWAWEPHLGTLPKFLACEPRLGTFLARTALGNLTCKLHWEPCSGTLLGNLDRLGTLLKKLVNGAWEPKDFTWKPHLQTILGNFTCEPHLGTLTLLTCAP